MNGIESESGGSSTKIDHFRISTSKSRALLANSFLLYSLHIQSPTSVFQLTDSQLIDNTLGLLPLIIGPPSLRHAFANKKVIAKDNVFVGTSKSFKCNKDVIR